MLGHIYKLSYWENISYCNKYNLTARVHVIKISLEEICEMVIFIFDEPLLEECFLLPRVPLSYIMNSCYYIYCMNVLVKISPL